MRDTKSNTMKSLLMIQPGAFGDIIACAPIAKWYADEGYEVHWPVRDKFASLLYQLDYVKPVTLDETTLDADWLRSDVMKILPMCSRYDKVLNLADRGPHPTAQMENESFEECKYRLAGVPIENKHRLTWSRDTEKENSLYDKVVKDSSGYAFCHLESSRGDRADLPDAAAFGDIVEANAIEGYSIYDWYKVITRANIIFCVESAMHQFIDGFIKFLYADCYVLSRSTLGAGETYSYSPFWDKRYIQ